MNKTKAAEALKTLEHQLKGGPGSGPRLGGGSSNVISESKLSAFKSALSASGKAFNVCEVPRGSVSAAMTHMDNANSLIKKMQNGKRPLEESSKVSKYLTLASQRHMDQVNELKNHNRFPIRGVSSEQAQALCKEASEACQFASKQWGG